jgi:hypothetical protein
MMQQLSSCQQRVTLPAATLPAVYNRIICAAVVDNRFRTMLLTNPAKAIAHGYNGEAFLITEQEANHLISIKAETLKEFASQLVTPPIPVMIPVAVAACD